MFDMKVKYEHKKTASNICSGLYIIKLFNLLFLGYKLNIDIKFIKNGFVAQVFKKGS